MPYVLALDQGTTSSRSILFDAEANVVATSQKEFRQYFPKPGWVEHDAEEIWSSQLETLQAVVQEAAVDPADITAIGITNQRETTVAWDASTGKAVCPAIVWQDRRTAPFCQELKRDGHADAILEKTGLVIDAYFSASKIRWMIENVPEVKTLALNGNLRVGTIDSWLLYRLTAGKVHATDMSNASRTMLFNINRCQWDESLLELFGIPSECLPEVIDSSGFLGETDPGVLGKPVQICGIAGDQQAALFGQLCHSPGMLKNTYGTGCFLLEHIGDQPRIAHGGVLTTVAWSIDGNVEYAMEGSVFIAGAALQWLRDGLGLIETAEETETLARELSDNDGVYFVPALAGLGTPHWDMSARGIITGLTRGTRREHLVRAALEAIAYQTKDIVRVMTEVTGTDALELRADGGASRNDFLMQFQADILGVPVVRPANTESTALGATFLAGIGAGLWQKEQLASLVSADKRFQPQMSQPDRNKLYQKWLDAVERSKNWADI